MTRILGIDPGSRVTGYGVIESDGYHSGYVTSGCVRAAEENWPERLRIIFNGIQELLIQYLPDQVAIEKVFMHRNVDSALKLGQARGAAICAVVNRSIAIHEYTPTEIKQSVVGKGNATKEQVQHMIQVLLKLSAAPQADAADALAIAICHANNQNTLSRMHGIKGMRKGRYW
ncbi:MAG: crossover junction endodeoxyribonuclease RuvC [Gammaproteobacteria bacterium]|nr:crossover junction endodeoxyribonuclease RuvC [Gammaproteobacteria bacterium]